MAGRDCDVLHAFTAVKIEILFYLRFLFTLGRFIDREFYEAVTIAHDLAHESRVLGRDVLVIEGENVAETHDILVKLDPRVHLVPTDIPDAMIDVEQPGFRGVVA